MDRVIRLLLIGMVFGLSAADSVAANERADVNAVAESYVRLVLEVGLYDEGYVDAYFGPPEWKPAETQRQDAFPAEPLRRRADESIERLTKIEPRGLTALERQRCAYLDRQLRSVSARIDLLAGRKMSFDEESKALYDVVAPVREEAYFQSILANLNRLVPGDAGDDLYWRFESFRNRFTIPRDRMEEVLRAVIDEYRRRTQAHLTLPDGEGFDLQFVVGKPWAAAATYKGNGLSLIEVNAMMPFGVAEVHDLAGHEVYPGHHVHLSLLDKHLVRDRKWMEYSVLPLYSPLAMIAEGIAEYGSQDLIMTMAERLEFGRTVLLPLAGLDPNQAELYWRIMELKLELDGALVEAARRYLDGRMTADETRQWLRQHHLASSAGVENLMHFIEKYRSYTINYTMGRRLVREWIDQQSGPNATPAQHWQLFRTLLSTPQTPSRLTASER